MALITDKLQNKRLSSLNVNIKTKYKVDDNIFERNSNNSKCDDIKNGIILEKKYYKNNYLMNKLVNFDPRIEYTFISQEEENKDITCPNCGKSGLVKEFIDGCPYCHTYYNVDYVEKELSSKQHLDQILHSDKYTKITFIIDLIVSLFIVFMYLYFNSRTFNIYDIFKVIIGTIILGFSMFYVFYIIDAYIILLPIKRYKERMNKKQTDFWNRMIKNGINKKTFFNNFNYELQEYYYSNAKNNNVIDYDIIDYLEYKDYYNNKNILCIDVIVNIRIVELINNKIKSKTINQKFTLCKNDIKSDEIRGGVNIITCHNCGASIDVTKDSCEYCKTKINYLQEWYLKDN